MPPTSNKQNISIPLAIILAGAMIAGAIYLGGAKNIPESSVPEAEIEIKEITSSDHILGNPDAEVFIIEYSDTECPWCKVFHNTMHQIVEEYEGKVAWVYRHVPYHKNAPKQAEATECAAELGGNRVFWEYLDELFETTNSNDSLDPIELPKIAGRVGLDMPTFEKCLVSGKYEELVKEYLPWARNLRLGTPYSVIISGKTQIPINGAEPIESVRAKIDSVLK